MRAPRMIPGRWAQGYDIPAVADGRIVQTGVQRQDLPAGMSALVFNTRKPLFADVRGSVRPMILAFDFGWINRNLYHSLYSREPRASSNGPISRQTARPPTMRNGGLLVTVCRCREARCDGRPVSTFRTARARSIIAITCVRRPELSCRQAGYGARGRDTRGPRRRAEAVAVRIPGDHQGAGTADAHVPSGASTTRYRR